MIPNGYKFKGIRIDSGDLIYLSKAARQMMDEAGYHLILYEYLGHRIYILSYNQDL